MYPIKQAEAIPVPFFVHDANGDGVTGLTNASFTKRISKNGGAFAAMTVVITEAENGWYTFPLSASHSDTLGLLSITFTNTGAKQVNLQWRVDSRIFGDLVDLNPDQSGVTIGTVNNVTGLVAGSGGISVAATVFVLTTGGAPTNDVTDTVSEDGVYHIIPPSVGNTDGYYEFNVGTSGIPQTITWLGYAQSNGDSYTISAYNFGALQYEPVGTINGANGTTPVTNTFDLLVNHVGTGAEAGEVRFRFDSADGTNFATDRIFCTYTEATSGIPNGSIITLEAPATNQTFSGHNWSMDFSGETISGAYLFQATSVIGTGVIANGNSVTLQECILNIVTLSAFFYMENCSLAETLTLTSTSGGVDDIIHIINGNSAVAGILTPTIDASALTKTTSLQSRKWGGGCIYSINAFCTLSHESTVGGAIAVTNAGGMAEIRGEITNVTVNSSLTAVTNITITSGGPIFVNGSAGIVNVFGLHGGITDNSGGAVTINDNGIDMIAIQNVTNSISIHSGLAQSATINTIKLDEGASALDGAYDPSSIRIVAGTGEGQTRLALQYDGTTKILVVDRDWKVTPDATSQFTINSDAGRAHVNEGLARGGTANTIILNALASDEDDAYKGQLCFVSSGLGADQTGTCIAYNGTTKELTIDKNWKVVPNITSGYAMLPASPVLLTDATQAQINALPSAVQNRQEMDSNSVDLNTILTNQTIINDNVSLNGTAIAALNNLSVGDILESQLTEGYAADGVAPTLTQALLLVQQMLGDFKIVGTTMTIKGLNGTTDIATFSLDDAADPTSITRSS